MQDAWDIVRSLVVGYIDEEEAGKASEQKGDEELLDTTHGEATGRVPAEPSGLTRFRFAADAGMLPRQRRLMAGDNMVGCTDIVRHTMDQTHQTYVYVEKTRFGNS